MSLAISSTAIVDFNSVEEDGAILVASSRLSGLIPTAGDLLTLADREGHTVAAIVRQIGTDRLVVDPIWQTWTSPASEIFELGPLQVGYASIATPVLTVGAVASTPSHGVLHTWYLTLPRQVVKEVA